MKEAKKVWQTCVILLALFSLYTLLQFGRGVLDYFSYVPVAKVDTVKMQPIEENERFFPLVTYTFSYQDRIATRQEVLFDESYSNPWKLEERWGDLAKELSVVFAAGDDVEAFTLVHRFPYKKGLYALVCCFLTLYFSSLSRFVGGSYR